MFMKIIQKNTMFYKFLQKIVNEDENNDLDN